MTVGNVNTESTLTTIPTSTPTSNLVRLETRLQPSHRKHDIIMIYKQLMMYIQYNRNDDIQIMVSRLTKPRAYPTQNLGQILGTEIVSICSGLKFEHSGRREYHCHFAPIRAIVQVRVHPYHRPFPEAWNDRPTLTHGACALEVDRM